MIISPGTYFKQNYKGYWDTNTRSESRSSNYFEVCLQLTETSLHHIENNWCTRVTNCVQRSWEDYFGVYVYFPSCEATKEINTKITLEWVQKQFVTRVHTSLYFLHEQTMRQMPLKATTFTQRPRASLAGFTFRWWRHNRLLMTSP